MHCLVLKKAKISGNFCFYGCILYKIGSWSYFLPLLYNNMKLIYNSCSLIRLSFKKVAYLLGTTEL